MAGRKNCFNWGVALSTALAWFVYPADMRIATFNIQNLRLREDAAGAHFDGARDEVLALSKLSASDRQCDARDRALTAQLIAETNPDLLALQEVFDQRTLDAFYDTYLTPLGVSLPFRVCVPGNDGRRRVALMSRYPLENVKSHAELTYADIGLPPPPGDASTARVFRRDCLTTTCAGVFLLVVHFKAPADEQSLAVVTLEAKAVRLLLERQFKRSLEAAWIVLGDFNVSDGPSDAALSALTESYAVDHAMQRPALDRWTYFRPSYDSYARPDRVLLSPAIASRASPLIINRRGMSRAATADDSARLDGVGEIRPRASDHALLAFDFDD